MKKTILTFLLMFTIIFIGGCDKKPPSNGDGEYDLGGIDFVIMANNAITADPRSAQYERMFKEEKIAKIAEVERKYNIKVVYKTYPGTATWGGARERWIIDQGKDAEIPPHVFEITSVSIPNLALKKAISPIDDYIEAYGSNKFWDIKKQYGLVLGKHYGYDDNYPFADDGLYYNSTLLGKVLNESRKTEPTDLWLEGNWDWEAFKTLSLELKDKLDHERTPEQGGPQYVLGGRTYNYLYGMVGANGTAIVDENLNTHLTEEPFLDVMTYLHSLYEVSGMWIDDAPLDNASQPQFKQGNVVFQNGQSWHIKGSNKWLGADFEINFVPWPKGPNIEEDMSNYRVSTINGNYTFVISSAYSKANIPAGYEDMMIHDETIFKIWADMQYFPESITEIEDDFYNVVLLPSYPTEKSREAHLSVFSMPYPDLFYSLDESKNHEEGAYMLDIQNAIQFGDERAKMESLESTLRAMLIQRYNLPENYYDE
ncbi:MAG: hypothetical protein RBS76_00680 [Acholeplasmatales bacterium]|nr:extracellular solute-binding protein [Acholeplasmataceae bacterium]MDY0114993.1 hypothetical protein [Acholeplasmatales bacterium]MCK9233771.1 extracellular solute-binding protein [Acholeplasmataceae bacterium]MCK9288994.1 extracellular solute-binding protein [Acholeplasmataceae bacterium]MCK9427869.1 extracellular solute-binding protein [Acholeplasmataceae bacterium]